MTPTELRAAVDELGWSLRGLAERLDADPRLIRRWTTGECSVPPTVASWLRLLVERLRETPPPAQWRRRARVSAHA